MNNKNSFIVISILLIFSVISTSKINAQHNLKGMVIDEHNNQILAFADLQLYSLPDSTFLKGIFSNTDGKYHFKDLDQGSYHLLVSYMGYENRTLKINLNKNLLKYDLSLVPVQYTLEEVEINAEKNVIQHNLEKTTINISKNETLTGGNAKDVMQSLPSVDIDIDGKIHYRGSDKVIILLNGAQSELISSLEQIPSEQIEKIEIINNPSAKYDAEGMSGIINIMLKKAVKSQRKSTFLIKAGYPETLGGNVGYSGNGDKTSFMLNAAINHQTKFQIKEHLRKNYEDPFGVDFHQFDRQDEIRNNTLINGSINYKINKNQQLQLSLFGSSKFNSADRYIEYSSLDKNETVLSESLKNIDIDLDNYNIDSRLNYQLDYYKHSKLIFNAQYALFDQLNEMNNEHFIDLDSNLSAVQNTYSKQHNREMSFRLDNLNPLGEKAQIESGLQLSVKDLFNDFIVEDFIAENNSWSEDADLSNEFSYNQNVTAAYLNVKYKIQKFQFQGGIRSEWTQTLQNDSDDNDYLDFFPSLSVAVQINDRLKLYSGYNLRINRPTIKMLNPYSYEYADILNRHTGNPHLQPEYVSSFELGGRLVQKKWTGSASVYYRDIEQAISRVKFAANDSALFVTYMNLEGAQMTGSEVFLSYDPFKFWHINASINLFRTRMNGVWENNEIDRLQNAWNFNLTNSFKLPYKLNLQLVAYYRSKLPDAMGIYKERYYMDMAISKKILDNKGRLVLKISDVFNTYSFGLDLDAIDENFYHYSQRNRRKNESQYFVLSFIYNISQKTKKEQEHKFFLERFGK